MVDVCIYASLFILGWWCGTQVMRWRRRPRVVPSQVEEAVKRAYLYVGLPEDRFSQDFNLLRAGKLQAVYHLAAHDLGVDPEFDTVGDVMRWLSE